MITFIDPAMHLLETLGKWPARIYIWETSTHFKKTWMYFKWTGWGAYDSAKNHKRQRRKRQSVTAKRGKSQTPYRLGQVRLS